MADYTRPRFTHTVSKWKYQFQITVLGCTVLCIESCNIDFLGGNAGGIFVNSLILMKNMKCQKLDRYTTAQFRKKFHLSHTNYNFCTN